MLQHICLLALRMYTISKVAWKFFFSDVKLPRRVVEQSLPWNSEANNECSYTSPFFIRSYDVNMDIIISTFTFSRVLLPVTPNFDRNCDSSSGIHT